MYYTEQEMDKRCLLVTIKPVVKKRKIHHHKIHGAIFTKRHCLVHIFCILQTRPLKVHWKRSVLIGILDFLYCPRATGIGPPLITSVSVLGYQRRLTTSPKCFRILRNFRHIIGFIDKNKRT